MGLAYRKAWGIVDASDAKTALWAADVHIAQNVLPDGERPMGSHLEAELGGDTLTERKPGSAEERLATYTFRPFADFGGIFFLARSPSMHPLSGCR